MENTMELSAQTLETIGQYVQRNLSTWLRDANLEREIALRERTVRVEEELKAQRELMREGFAHMEKRFEQVDKRFEEMGRNNTRWFTVLSLMLAILGAAATISQFM